MKRFLLSNVFLGTAARAEADALNALRDHYPWPPGPCEKCAAPTRLGEVTRAVTCPTCGATRSEWSGTILDDSRAPLVGVLTALRAMGEANPGIQDLQSRSGLARETVVNLRQKTRGYCAAWQADQVLSGDVEVDEMLLRGKKLSGRANDAVLVLATMDGTTALAVPVADQSAATLEAAIAKHVAPGATVFTDAWRGYGGLAALGYDHAAAKQPRLTAAHAATKSLRCWLRADARQELNLAGKAAHWALVYSHRHMKTRRADALLDACMPARARAVATTHVVRVPIRLSRVERRAVNKRLSGQDLFNQLLYKRAHARLHNAVGSAAWRRATPKERRDQWDALGFTNSWLEHEATSILRGNADVADYVDRATANALTRECFDACRKAAWNPRTRGLPRPQWRRAWNGANQRQGLRYDDGYLVHSTRRMSGGHALARRKLRLRFPWHALSGERRAYYEGKEHAIRRVGLSREKIRGRTKWFASLTVECAPFRGASYLASLPADGVVGLDVNKYAIGVTSDKLGASTAVSLDEMALAVRAEARRLQSQLDKKKNGNPDYATSKRYWRLHEQWRRASRNATIHRNDAHRLVARELRRLGATLVTERDNVNAWRRGYARDTKLQAVAPATLIGFVRREYAATGGDFVVAPRSVAATSTCPGCGAKQRKDPRNRAHACANQACQLHGKPVDRDAAASLNLALAKSRLNKTYGLREAHAGAVLPVDASDPGAGASAVTTAFRTALEMRSPSQFVNVTVQRK